MMLINIEYKNNSKSVCKLKVNEIVMNFYKKINLSAGNRNLRA
jgi:hypothetical protein